MNCKVNCRSVVELRNELQTKNGVGVYLRATVLKRCLPGNEQTNKAVKKKKRNEWYRSMHAVTTECRYTNGVGGF